MLDLLCGPGVPCNSVQALLSLVLFPPAGSQAGPLGACLGACWGRWGRCWGDRLASSEFALIVVGVVAVLVVRVAWGGGRVAFSFFWLVFCLSLFFHWEMAIE